MWESLATTVGIHCLQCMAGHFLYPVRICSEIERSTVSQRHGMPTFADLLTLLCLRSRRHTLARAGKEGGTSDPHLMVQLRHGCKAGPRAD